MKTFAMQGEKGEAAQKGMGRSDMTQMGINSVQMAFAGRGISEKSEKNPPYVRAYGGFFSCNAAYRADSRGG